MFFALDRLARFARLRDAVWLGTGLCARGTDLGVPARFHDLDADLRGARRAGEWLGASRSRCSAGSSRPPARHALMAPYLCGLSRAAPPDRLRAHDGRQRDARRAPGSSYLITGSRLHFGLWSHRFFGNRMSATFPGVVGWRSSRWRWRGPNWRDARLRMCLVAGVGCAVVSMLPGTPIFPVLYRRFRSSARFACRASRPVRPADDRRGRRLRRRGTGRRGPTADLAGRGGCRCARSRISKRCGRRSASRRSVTSRRSTSPSRVSATPSSSSCRSIRRRIVPNAGYMLNSTIHWQPMLNGYSGFRPAGTARPTTLSAVFLTTGDDCLA